MVRAHQREQREKDEEPPLEGDDEPKKKKQRRATVDTSVLSANLGKAPRINIG